MGLHMFTRTADTTNISFSAVKGNETWTYISCLNFAVFVNHQLGTFITLWLPHITFLWNKKNRFGFWCLVFTIFFNQQTSKHEFTQMPCGIFPPWGTSSQTHPHLFTWTSKNSSYSFPEESYGFVLAVQSWSHFILISNERYSITHLLS